MTNQTRRAQKGRLKAVGYVRVSTAGQAISGLSLEAQREAIASYAKLHGLELVVIKADEGRSAKTVSGRPALQEALRMIRRRQAGVLVVCKLDRLARSLKDALAIAEQLDRCQADMVSLAERIDTSSAMGRFFFQVMGALAELERGIVAERTSTAMRVKQAKGEYTGGNVPYGYALDTDGIHLTADRRQQKVIRRVVKLHGTGLSLRSIARDLTASGLPAPLGGRRWNFLTVKRILDWAKPAGQPG